MQIPFFVEKVRQRMEDGSLVELAESQTLHQNRQILTNMHNKEDISKIHTILSSKHLLYMVSSYNIINIQFNSIFKMSLITYLNYRMNQRTQVQLK